jgi:hypothetical protein
MMPRMSTVVRRLADHLSTLLLLIMLVLMGVALGVGMCIYQAQSRPDLTLPRPLSYQEQLDVLDERVRALEHR